MSSDSMLLLIVMGLPVIAVTLCNFLDKKYRPKFWNPYFQAELCSCLIPLFGFGVGIYRVFMISMYYGNEELE